MDRGFGSPLSSQAYTRSRWSGHCVACGVAGCWARFFRGVAAVVRWGAVIGLAVLAAAWSAGAAAADWLVGSGLAKHLDGGEHCNSVTTGLGIERNDVALGFYRNSNCRWSVYAAKALMPVRTGALRAGAMAGVVTGYGRPITPAGALAAAIEGERLGVNVIYVPPIGGSGNVLWLQIKRRF